MSKQRGNGETGADIIAQKNGVTTFIEIIGFQSSPPLRSREFYESFFRVISRDNNNLDDVLVLALPNRFRIGMPQRKKQYLFAWGKLGSAFPNLQIWYINNESQTIDKHSWSNPF